MRDEIDIGRLFQSETAPLREILRRNYSIPIYQRDYSWGENAVRKLLDSVSEGISNLERGDQGSVTFIGTIICTGFSDNRLLPTFSDKGYSVVDGQQRLTTLSLSCCAIHQYITERWNLLSNHEKSSEFFREEYEYLDRELSTIMLGTYDDRESGFNNFFPRIIREMDDSWKHRNNEFNSPVASYLSAYAKHIRQNKGVPQKFTFSVENEHLKSNTMIIEEYIHELCRDKNADKDLDRIISFPGCKEIMEKGKLRNVLLKTIKGQPNKEMFAYIFEGDGDKPLKARELLLCMAFSNYMLDRVAFSFIESKEEKYAFDIFEALNTTGEPLTAIETLKPLAVEAKKRQGRGEYKQSRFCQWFDDIDKYLREEGRFGSLADQQIESVEIVLNFALLYDGTKGSKQLSFQRNYLRESFNKLEQYDHKVKFVEGIHGIANYRRIFWTGGIDSLSNSNIPSGNTNEVDREKTLFCLLFLKKIKTSLTIPILARYYNAENNSDFSEVVMALTSFVAIWRAYHGGTGGIDNKLRSIMAGSHRSNEGNDPASMGTHFENRLPDIGSFKQYLRDFLEDEGLNSKDVWVKSVIKKSLYKGANKSLCKFMLLSAAHEAGPKSEGEYILEKERPSSNKDYMTIEKWDDDSLATIEHIAPQNPRDDKVDDEYKDTIGNLMLLPKGENKIVGNLPWEDKRMYFQLFSERKYDKTKARMEEMRKKGIKISKRTESIINNGECLPAVLNLDVVEDWNTDVIRERSENIASLTWDEIRPWIDP